MAKNVGRQKKTKKNKKRIINMVAMTNKNKKSKQKVEGKNVFNPQRTHSSKPNQLFKIKVEKSNFKNSCQGTSENKKRFQ